MTDSSHQEARAIKAGKRRIKMASPSGEAPPLPDSLRYQGTLGRGGMSLVVAAVQASTGQTVAVKFLPPALSEESVVERFRREAAELSRLSHPNVVRLLDTGRHAGQEYLVMEYVEGGNLLDFLARNPSLDQILEFFCQVCQGLEHVHAAGVVHRDLKPENILVAADGTPKLTDFGLALRAGRKTRLTEGGAILGTYAFLAPEQILSSDVGPPADLYSLGMCLYEALAGRPPFQAETEYGLLQAHLKEEPPPLGTFRPGVPKELELLLRALLAKKPEDRPSVTETRARLERILRKIRAADAEPERGSAPSRRPLAATALLLLTAGLGFWLLYRTTLDVQSQPPGALVLVDGEPEGTTPLRARWLWPGEHRIELRLDGFNRETVSARARLSGTSSVSAVLTRRGLLALQVTPEPVEVWVDGEPLAEARSGERLPIDSGARQVELRKEGYRPHARTLSVPEAGEVSLQAELVSQTHGTVRVSSDPPGAEVSLQDEPRGKAPLRLAELEPGEYVVALRKPGYETFEARVKVAAGEEASLEARMKPAVGSLSIQTTPPGATVFLDGARRGSTPLELHELKPGAHEVRLLRAGFFEHKTDAQVAAGETSRVQAALQPSVGSLGITSDPAGARVIVNGQSRGETPVSLANLPPKRYSLVLERAGYYSARKAVDLAAGQKRNLAFHLEPVPPPPPAPPAPGDGGGGGGGWTQPPPPVPTPDGGPVPVPTP